MNFMNPVCIHIETSTQVYLYDAYIYNIIFIYYHGFDSDFAAKLSFLVVLEGRV